MKQFIKTNALHFILFLITICGSIYLAVKTVNIVSSKEPLCCTSLIQLSAILAQVLAEIFAVIIILPQLVLQLSSISYRRDMRDIFRTGTVIYFLFYVIGLILLSFSMPAYLIENEKHAYQLTFFIFIVLLFLIFPFLNSQISTYRNPRLIFKPLVKKAKRKIKKLCKQPQKDGQELQKLSREIKDAASDYGNKNRDFFQAGIKSLMEIFIYGYQLTDTKQSDFLVNILNTTAQIGISMEAVEAREFIIDEMLGIEKTILKAPKPAQSAETVKKGTKSQITYYTTEVIEVIVQISIQKKQLAYNQTLSKSIKSMFDIFQICISSPYREQVEYPIFAEAFRKIALFALTEGHLNACRDAVQIMSQMITKQLKQHLPIPSTSVFKSCESMADIATLAAQQKNEKFCMVSINRLRDIISDVRRVEADRETREKNLITVLANFLEATSNIWVLFPAMQDWLKQILRSLYTEQHIKFHDYLRPAREIIAMKSAVSLNRFDQFKAEFKS